MNNWQTKKIGEVCEVVGGGTPKSGVSEYWDGDIFWVTPKDLGKIKVSEISDTERKISKEGLKNSSARLLPTGSVILSSRAPIGYVVINTVPMATNQGCRSFICGPEIFNKYLYYFLILNTKLLNSLGSGSTFLEVSGSRLKEIEIPLPPLSKQKEIVKMLDEKMGKIGEAKRLRAEALADTEKILPQTLHEIFEEGKKNGWEKYTLGEISEINMGQSPKGETYNTKGEGLPLINGPVEFSAGQSGETHITKYTSKPTKICKKGDLILCVRGSTTGKTNIAGRDSCIGRGVASIRAKSNFDQGLINIFIALQRNYIFSLGTGSTFPNINYNQISNLIIFLPPLAEQQKIVAKLDALSEKVRTLRTLQTAQLADLKSLEKAYLREAFDGEL